MLVAFMLELSFVEGSKAGAGSLSEQVGGSGCDLSGRRDRQ
jgi:hypothetical protein